MKNKLLFVKLVHTVVWVFYVIVIGSILYCGIFDKVGILTFTAIGLVLLEGLVLVTFKGKCPLTILGYRYTDHAEAGFDIFLPKWLAKNNKLIFGTLFAIGTVLSILRVIL